MQSQFYLSGRCFNLWCVFFGLIWDCSPPLCHYRPRPQLARHSRTRPRIPGSRQHSVSGPRRVVFGFDSELQPEAAVPPDTRPRYGQPFLSACLETVYHLIRLFTLLSSYKAMACCLHSDFHPATVKAHRTWLRLERFKSRSSARMCVSDAYCGSAAPNRVQRCKIIKTAPKTTFRVHISPEQTRREWKVKRFPEDQLNPDRFGSVLIFRNVNNNR